LPTNGSTCDIPLTGKGWGDVIFGRVPGLSSDLAQRHCNRLSQLLRLGQSPAPLGAAGLPSGVWFEHDKTVAAKHGDIPLGCGCANITAFIDGASTTGTRFRSIDATRSETASSA